ncbi:GNAT family N-acetyltransferase [Wenzhouxiangella limi]|uniref:N-acetyltransferase n=1 Tax=Wenzhouxiangella limi TaxID=2707351 RepID=A0A845V3S2_9GAMM|nr:GNAT family N-acetyltransferase [Wenzhouxiangella limi]NDY94635.1 N-acetyltransferase [Wenzhouxiangella limi]
MSEPINHLSDQRLFRTIVEDHACELHYSFDDDIVSFDSVRVPDAVGGRGIAGRLTRHALDWARAQDLSVRPACPYVATWIKRHPDYADRVA